MLKRRIIPVELLSEGRLVKTVGFSQPRDVGDPVKSSQVYSDQDADELVLLQIDRRERNVAILADAVSEVAAHCFVPLTAGGGITRIEHAKMLFDAGADKVLINSATYLDLALVSSIVKHYGRQAVVVGIDVNKIDGEYILYSDCGRKRESVTIREHINAVTAAGAGELMIQAIHCDGVMQGYDLELLQLVVGCAEVPVIVCSGAGHFLHLKEAIELGADAVACGSLFNFGDNNPLRAKAFLKNYGIPLKKV